MQDMLPSMIDAIHTRRSCRQFHPMKLIPDHAEKLQEFMKKMEIPFDHKVSLTYHNVPQDQDIVYFKGPKQFIALSTSRSPIEQAKLGFLGEQLILYSESIGIRTCWMGHYRTKEVEDIVYGAPNLDDNHPLYCIILLGYVPEKTGLLDRFSQRRLSKKNRTLESFLHEHSLTEFPDFIKSSLELASRAPSAMNSQKWYYLVQKTSEGYSIELSKPKGYQHFKWKHYDIDVGTAALHIWLGLRDAGIEAKVDIINRDGDAAWRFHCSV
ncbi:MAG: nitroreductase family protein [Candidatus Odinarchaeota archaeon]